MARKLNIRSKKTKPTRRKKTTKTSTKQKHGFVGRTAKGFGHAREINKEHRRRRKAGFLPFRFWLAVDDEAKVIVLDEGAPFFMYEHNWKGNSGHWDQYEVCIKEKASCPLCQKYSREGQYVMMLTIIDKRPYVNKKGETIPFTRKLLPVKPMMIPKFERLFKEHGTFRGMYLTLTRDNEGGTNIGDSVDFIKMLSEKALTKYKEKAVAVDYDKEFPMKSEAQLRSLYGGDSVAGSEDIEDDDDEDLDDVEFDDDEDDED